MSKQLKTTLLSFLLILGSSQVGYAQVSDAEDLDRAVEAYNDGDYATSLKITKPLAQQGNARAQRALAFLYYLGRGVTKDAKEAVKWFRLAAEQGDARAQNMLGFIYENGQGVIQDNVYAHMWFNIALANGIEEAKENRDTTAKRMTPSQIEYADKLARECIRKEYKGC